MRFFLFLVGFVVGFSQVSAFEFVGFVEQNPALSLSPQYHAVRSFDSGGTVTNYTGSLTMNYTDVALRNNDVLWGGTACSSCGSELVYAYALSGTGMVYATPDALISYPTRIAPTFSGSSIYWSRFDGGGVYRIRKANTLTWAAISTSLTLTGVPTSLKSFSGVTVATLWSVVYRSDNSDASWNKNRTLSGTLNDSCISDDQKYVYVASSSGAFVSSDYGSGFTLRQSGNFSKVSCSGNGKYSYYKTSGSIYRSSDYGVTYALSFTMPSGDVWPFDVSNDGKYFVALGVAWTWSAYNYRSIDSGWSFTNFSRNYSVSATGRIEIIGTVTSFDSCDDGIMNQDETAVDYGGVCLGDGPSTTTNPDGSVTTCWTALVFSGAVYNPLSVTLNYAENLDGNTLSGTQVVQALSGGVVASWSGLTSQSLYIGGDAQLRSVMVKWNTYPVVDVYLWDVGFDGQLAESEYPTKINPVVVSNSGGIVTVRYDLPENLKAWFFKRFKFTFNSLYDVQWYGMDVGDLSYQYLTRRDCNTISAQDALAYSGIVHPDAVGISLAISSPWMLETIYWTGINKSGYSSGTSVFVSDNADCSHLSMVPSEDFVNFGVVYPVPLTDIVIDFRPLRFLDCPLKAWQVVKQTLLAPF